MAKTIIATHPISGPSVGARPMCCGMCMPRSRVVLLSKR